MLIQDANYKLIFACKHVRWMFYKHQINRRNKWLASFSILKYVEIKQPNWQNSDEP